MKVVHLTTTDFGGAYKAVERIKESLGYYDIESKILVRSRFFETKTIEVMDTPVKRLLSKTRNFINLLLSHGEVITDILGADLHNIPEICEADVIMLHWVNSFVSPGTIRKLARLRKPIVWVMHDMWAFTGGCHYDGYCGRYAEECGKCPFLNIRRKGISCRKLKAPRRKDISYYNLKSKKALFDRIEIAFVAISRWEKECAGNSLPLRGKNVTWISNPLNTDLFKPLDPLECKRLIEQNGLEVGAGARKVILFGADKALENPTKGFRYLVEALQKLDGTKYMAVCFGKAPEYGRIELPNMEIRYLGTIRDEKILAEWYNIADVFVAPSIQEGFGYTVCEALSCGTPVTAFRVGGILDQIEHGRNGFLAELYSSEELAEGIMYCSKHRDELRSYARERVEARNSYRVIGKQYHDLCMRIVK